MNFEFENVRFNRIALVNLLVSQFASPKYLEIGCDTNSLFDSVMATHKIGVDPLSGGTHRMTSDVFFAQNSMDFDVVFIDGLHTYEQVRKDVINSISCLRKKGGGWIALHDMLPQTWISQHVPQVAFGSWNGDVWKVAFELVGSEGLEFRIVKIDHGVGIIRVSDSDNLSPDLRPDLIPLLEKANFSYYADNLGHLPIVEWQDASAWITSAQLPPHL